MNQIRVVWKVHGCLCVGQKYWASYQKRRPNVRVPVWKNDYRCYIFCKILDYEKMVGKRKKKNVFRTYVKGIDSNSP